MTPGADEERLDIDTGQVIAGHYRVLERIGSGGMGVVWRARDERLQRVVAIKQLLLQPGLSAVETANAHQRTLREARIAARLQHTNAIVVFDVAEHEGEPCLVLEYMASRSLAAVLAERGTLPAAEVAGIGRQVASALAAAHAAGIVHRDVKPGNILIGDTGLAKITDFGVSRAAGDATVTQTGMMAGTPAYLAPEVARGQQPTPASDVFSLGATLYAAVEGRSPFGTTQNQLAMLHAAAAGYVAPPRQAGSLASVLMDLLREDSARRPDMVQAMSALAAAARGSGAALPTALLSGPGSRASDGAPPRTLLQHTAAPTAVAMPRAASPRLAPGRTPPGSTPPGSTSPAEGRRPQRTRLKVALLAVLLVLGGAGVVALLDRDGADGMLQAGRNQPAAAPVAPPPAEPSTAAEPPPAEPSVAPEPAPPGVSDGNPIEYSPAGQLVIDYYTGVDDVDSAWAMLSPRARASFGDEAGFRAYWEQYSQVSARNAQGVTTNDDGSVTVPVDVTYDDRSEQRKLRVTRLDGKLLIDSEAR